MIRACLAIVDQVSKRVANLGVLELERLELGLGIRPHLRIGLGVDHGLSFLDLPGQIEVARVRDRDLRQRPTLLGERGEARAVGSHRRIEKGGLQLLEPLIVGL